MTCPQLPMVVTYGSDETEALAQAIDAIEVALASMIEDGDDIPRPDEADGVRSGSPC